MNNRKAIGALVAIGFAIRFSTLLFYHQIALLQRIVEGNDAIGYTQLAQNLFYEHTFRFAQGGPTAYRMPGYPLFLAITYAPLQNPILAQILQIAADLLTIVIVYQIGKYVFSNEETRLLAAALVALNPLVWITSISLRPETLAIFCVSLAILFLCRFPYRLLGGLGASVALIVSVYLKPTFLVFAIALPFVFAVRWIFKYNLNKAARAFFLLISVMLALLAPWTARNLLVMNAFIPLTTSNGCGLYAGNNPQADGGSVFDKPWVLPGMSEIDSDRVFTQLAIDWIKSNPVQFAKLLPARAIRFFWPLSFDMARDLVVPDIVLWIVLLVVVAFYLFVVRGVWYLTIAKRFGELAILGTVPVMLLLLTLLTSGSARYSLPAFPSFAIFASLGLEVFLQRFRSRRCHK
jgi:hypothetical protein